MENKVERKRPNKTKKNKSPMMKKQKIDKTIKKETPGDNSVFAVTEKLLQNKKVLKQKKKKLESAKQKSDEQEEKKKSKKDEHALEMETFFIKSEPENVLIKPNWHDMKLKNLIAIYLLSVENNEKEKTLQTEMLEQQNKKILFRFYHKLAQKLEIDIGVVKHWFHLTKEDILKSDQVSKAQTSHLKISVFNRKIKAISKETTKLATPKIKSQPATWFDDHFAELLAIRNKAKRQWKTSPTEENEKAFRLAFKNVKTELVKRKKSGFVSEQPYVPKKKADNFKPRPKGSFGTKIMKPASAKFSNNNKHIKFDD